MLDSMFLLGAVDFCKSTATIWQLVGRVLLVFKIVIPILLIIFGMMDLGKAVVANKDDEIKKATKQLAMRAVAAVVIFFVPTLVGFIFSIVDGFTDTTNGVSTDYETCRVCIVTPSKCDTASAK